jgi:hypothetical protein
MVCWTVWQWLLHLPMEQVCRGLAQVVWAPASLGGKCPLVWAGSCMWCHEKLVYEQSPAPFTNMAVLWARIEFFSWKTVSFSSLPVSPRPCNVVFTKVLLSHPSLTWGMSAQCSLPSPSDRGAFGYLASSFVQGGCNQPPIYTRPCGSI